MNEQELKALTKTLGEQATAEISKQMASYDAAVKKLEEQVKAQEGGVTEVQFKEWKDASEKMMNEVKDIAAKQGTTLAELGVKLQEGNGKIKSMDEQLSDDSDTINEIRMSSRKSGTIDYIIDFKSGTPILVPFKADGKFTHKAAGPMATIAGANGGSEVSSISQSIDSATLLRLAIGSPINNLYRNTPWIFDLCNTINGTFDASSAFAVWFDEVSSDGGATTVTEGGTKPKTQYKYIARTATYKKKATILQLTEEFSIDFAQLQNNIMNVGRVDVLNKVNDDVLTDLISNATAYNSATAFKGGTGIANVNDYDAIAALAAQVDNSTFGSVKANAAVMSTNKLFRMGLQKNTLGSYLNAPDVLSNIGFVANPSVTGDSLLVGDFKQYNILLRGGMIVRVGYNGTDFGENKFSVVMEQYYMNYISTARKPAIVSGPDFSTIKTAISA